MTVRGHHFVGVGVQLEVKQGAMSIWPTPKQLGAKGGFALGVQGHVEDAADNGFFADLEVSDDRVVGALARGRGEHALDQHLQLTPADLFTKDTGLDDFGVIEDQQVARIKEVNHIGKHPVNRLGLAPIEQA